MPVISRDVINHGNAWAVKKGRADRVSKTFRTQEDAIAYAKKVVANLGGGEVRIQGRDGKWRDTITVPNGNDPFPPRG